MNISETNTKSRIERIYEVGKVQDTESAIRWIADLAEKPFMSVVEIQLVQDYGKFISELAIEFFDRQKFIQNYKDCQFDKIRVFCFCHNAEFIISINLKNYQIKISYDENISFDYRTIELGLKLV